jgi:hypothetical protein
LETQLASIAEHRDISVRKAILLHPTNGAVATIGLWSNLDKILLPIIGRQNLNCILARSQYLNEIRLGGSTGGCTFLKAKSICFDVQEGFSSHEIDEMNLASIGLLNTFIDILILLIGEGLTEQVLNLAWGEQGSTRFCTV